ncbi:MAG: response regulator [Caldithrix sp.]|nr:response regulator [Caldithrix sp.]
MLIDDNKTMLLGMEETLSRAGFHVHSYENGPEALKFFKKHPVPLMITDLKMEPMDGIDVLKEVKKVHPQTEALLISAFGTVEDAVQAMQLGASDFLTKPFSNDELRVRVNKLFERIYNNRLLNQLQAENQYLYSEISGAKSVIIGQSEPIKNIFALINRVSAEESAILIEGESGTGKELVARAIHSKSQRADKPFIKINCGALNDNLLESELFGHEKGAFTGAIKQKRGRFELADGGTLFLDEIGDISTAMQVKLLRVLQEMEFERVGSEETLSVDVRIISATNRNLEESILQEKFRKDLYYRLSVIPIKLPALRSRKEDIPLLVQHFLNHLNETKNQNKKLSAKAIELFKDYSWPGNIRELENFIERLYVITDSEIIDEQTTARYLGNNLTTSSNYESMPLDEALFMFEKNMINQAMKQANGVKNRAAKLLGIKTSALYYKLEKFGML